MRIISAQILIFLTVLNLFFSSFKAYAEDQDVQVLTQEQFAVELVKMINLEGSLPTAALPSDCVDFLERIGISPLGGWNNKAVLSQEEYLVILAKAQGKEVVLHERALSVENKNIEVINKKWQEAFDKTGAWPSLSDLLMNKDYFPDGPLKSPYGLKYQDKNNDHKVDQGGFPVVGLIRFRESFSH